MEFVILASAHFIALLSPGPDFFLLVQAGLRLSRWHGFLIAGGIATANFIYIIAAICGLEITRQISWLDSALRFCGAAYLVWIGIMILRAPMEHERNGGGFLINDGRRHCEYWAAGFMSALLNPKNAIFYLSLFTAIVSSYTPLTYRGLYGIWMVAVVFLWDCVVVAVLGGARVQQRLGNTIFVIEKISGGMLLMLGLFLPFS